MVSACWSRRPGIYRGGRTALGFVHDVEFVKRYFDETQEYVLPYAKEVNADMFRERSDLNANRRLVAGADSDLGVSGNDFEAQ